MVEFGYYNADCMDIMRELPDKYIDLAIVDPPYGIKADKGTNGFGTSEVRKYKGGWDSEPPSKEYFDELMRVSENQIVWGAQYMTEHLKQGTKWLVWDKVGEIKFENPFSKCELAWTSFNGTVEKFLCKQMGFVSEEKDERIHPTQKPIALYKWVLSNYAKEGDIILDTHVGSASSLIACEDMGFKYIGCEIDKAYYEQSKKRIERHTAQLQIKDFLEIAESED